MVAAGISAFALVATTTALASTTQFGFDQVGQVTDKGRVISSNQYIDPYGDRMVIDQGKMMSSEISPDGKHIAASLMDGGQALAVLNLSSWKTQQLVSSGSSSNPRLPTNKVGQEGPTYSPDGKQLWLGQPDGFTKLTVGADGNVTGPAVQVPIPKDGSKQALVGEPVFSADGSTVYAAVNGQNRVVAIDTATNAITKSWDVGNAPRDMVMVGSKLYVSNEGGRKAQEGDPTINSYGTQVPADQKTAATTTGTVSVIDVADPSAEVSSIKVGLHPTSLYAKDGAVFVTNTNDNNVSVIDAAKGKVVQTISTQPWPESKVGYEPTASVLTKDGHLLVTLGRANAVAVYRYTSAQEPVSYIGLLPTDYFPSEITTRGDEVIVSNTRGIDARRPTTAKGYTTHDTQSSLTHFTLPSDKVVKEQTAKVFKQNGWTRGSVEQSRGGNVKPVPVPVRIGDPSTIKHVFLLVKENRTYDQVYGDMPEGNGDPDLAQYGENVTPNQHVLARQFGLYDNTYDIGTASSEGHNWLMQADNPEYTESSAGEYIRSYDTEDDALGHQKTGFIWTGVQDAGKSVRDYGEFQQFLEKPADATWQNLYCDAKNMRETGADTNYNLYSSSPIPSLNDVSLHSVAKFDTSVPDIYRAELWKQEFREKGPADFNMFWLSSDHTGGPLAGPAQVADNDLAVGRIVDEISHSKYWKSSAIFVLEDDSQNGLDHIDGHRAPVSIISPWAKRGVVDSHYYSQINIIRTIEQILGAHPMNQKDSAATPMSAAFTSRPDYTPFNAVPNRTSLTDGLKGDPPTCGLDTPAKADPDAAAVPKAADAPASMEKMVDTWNTWKTKQRLTGEHAIPDFANPAQMNHLSWYEAHEWKKPYPGESKIYAPDDVPGAYLPSPDHDG